MERLPWVATADVSRKWPNVVQVTIVERTAIGAVAVPGGVALLDVTGRVLATASTPPAGVIGITTTDRIPGPGATVTGPVRDALRILHGMSSTLATQVETVHRLAGAPPTFDVDIAGAVLIRLGGVDRLSEKLAAAEAVLGQQRSPGTVIDVRVPRSPTVTHRVIPNKG